MREYVYSVYFKTDGYHTFIYGNNIESSMDRCLGHSALTARFEAALNRFKKDHNYTPPKVALPLEFVS